MKKLSLQVKNVKNQNDLRKIKNNFEYELRKPRMFKGHPIILAKQDVSPEECWLKFVAGGKFNNKQRKVNNARVARIHWIFEILEIYRKYDDPTKIFSNIKESTNPNSLDEITVSIEDKNYNLYFKKEYKDGVFQKFILLTAYSKRKTD